MSKCLLTTLKEAVTDTDMLKLGEMKVKVLPAIDQYTVSALGIYASQEVVVTVRAPGHITNVGGTANLGSTTTVPANTYQEIHLSQNGNYEVVVSNKYAIQTLSLYQHTLSGVWGGAAQNMTLYHESLYGMNNVITLTLNGKCNDFELKEFNELPSLDNLSCSSVLWGHLQGDISGLKDVSLLELSLSNNKKITGSLSSLSHMEHLAQIRLSNCDITGNISDLVGKPLTLLNLSNCTKVSGNIASLSNMTTLTSLNLSSTGVTGDTSSLAGLTNLTTFTYTNTAITGTWPLT